jgi:SapC
MADPAGWPVNCPMLNFMRVLERLGLPSDGYRLVRSLETKMPSIVPISKERHANRKWRRLTNYKFASTISMVPIVDAELNSATLAMPLAFAQMQGSFVLVAILSLAPNRNLLVAPDGRWLGAYIPACFRAHPFLSVPRERAEESIVVVDEGSGLVVGPDGAGEDFFDADGNISSALRQVVDFLKGLDARRRTTNAAVSALAAASVLKPWPVVVKTEHGEQTISSLHCINETALNALADDVYLRLRASSALPIVYSQLLSMGMLNLLNRLAQAQNELMRRPTKDLPESLDSIFKLQDDSIIKF